MEFIKYKQLVERYYQNDCRELNFQNREIIPFLESVITEARGYEVIDSSTLYKNWSNYKNENGDGICRELFANNYTPDLLIVSNWKLFDKKKTKPSIIVEVKRPTAKDRLHAIKEVEEYLEKVNHVILTDCITWEFYDKEYKLSPIFYYLDTDENYVCKRDVIDKRQINWISDSARDNDWEKIKKGIIGRINSDL